MTVETTTAQDTLTGRANACRIYDSLIGGSALAEIDEGPISALLNINPGTPAVAKENRQFMLRAARVLAEQYGVRQFLDLGCSYPTAKTPNLHEVVGQVDPSTRVVYIDREEDAIDAWAPLIEGNDHVQAAVGHVERPESVLAQDTVASGLDWNQPIAVVLTGVFPFISDQDDPWGVVAAYRDTTPAGSYLVLSHALTSEDWPEGAEEVLSMYREHIQPMFPRLETQVRRFFDGYTLLEPGLISTPGWRPDEQVPPELLAFKRAVAGVAVKD